MSLARPIPPDALAEKAEPLFSARGLFKAYGQVQALVDVSIGFLPGEVHAIVGENGAGKSTLTRLIAGEEQPDRGEIAIAGRVVRLASPWAARRAGIAIVHQQFQLIEALTVAENICLEDVPLRRIPWLAIRDGAAMMARARTRLAPFGLQDRAGAPVRDLGVAERQVVEICRALGTGARVLILDEPTSALSAAETDTLFRRIRQLRDQGVAVIFIAHNLAEVLSIADRISVLRDGRLITTAPVGALDAANLARLIVGRELAAPQAHAARQPGDTVLEASRAGSTLIALRHGEIIGIPTYIGSSLRRLIARISGEGGAGGLDIRLAGADISHAGISGRVRRGLCLVPGDATADALAPKLSIADNILLPNTQLFTRAGLLMRGRVRREVMALIRDLDIRPARPDALVETLSGGNRQKVAIARWLLSGARVLVMDDPTRGVDVGAKLEIYRIMRGHVERRGAILLASSDLDELIGLADRLVVVRGEDVVARMEQPFQKSEILAAASRDGAAYEKGTAG